MVKLIRNHHIAGPVHRQTTWAVEASEDAFIVLEGYFFVLGSQAMVKSLPEGVSWRMVSFEELKRRVPSPSTNMPHRARGWRKWSQ